MSVGTAPAVLAPPARPPRATVRSWLALATLMLPVVLVSVDNTVLSFALPQISQHLEPTAAQQLWIIDAYPLVLAGLLVSMGTLGDRVGRRRMLLVGAVGFALVSIVAAFAPSAAVLIGARAALGFFGAMIMPATLSLLRSLFLDPDQRRLAIAVWASGFAAGSALGPLVGGILLAHFAWGSVFLLAVPVLVPLVILVPLLVPESKDPAPGRFDPLSIALSLVAMVAFVGGIKTVAEGAQVALGIGLLVLGVLVGAGFVSRQLRRPDPMLDMSLFRRARFSTAVLVNLFSVISLVGFLYVGSQHLQLVLGLSPVESGLVILPGLVVMVVAGLVIVPIAKRVGPHLTIPLALLASLGAYTMVALGPEVMSAGYVMVAFALLGLGIGAAETVSNDLILAQAPVAKAGAASAVSETAYELGAVLGTAVIGGALAALYRGGIQLPAGLSPEAVAHASETLAGATVEASRLPAGAGDALLASAQAAFESGVVVAAWIGVGLMLAAIALAALTLRPARGGTARVAARAGANRGE